MSSAVLLDELQALLARVMDVPVQLSVAAFHLEERALCAQLLGRELGAGEDEQVLLRETRQGAELSVFVDPAVLARLGRANPLVNLGEANLADFCTALEGVSHFQYLVWCIRHRRQLSLLELELQAEVDKYAVAAVLLRRQGRTDLPRGLWQRLFAEVQFFADQAPDIRQRYVEANRHAAYYCQQLERRFLNVRRFRPEAWLRGLREFYRQSHHQKLRCAMAA